MSLHRPASVRLGSTIGIIFAAALSAAPSPAANIDVPPVTITSLTHEVSPGPPTRVNDAVTIPETTCGRGCCYWLTACEGPGYATNSFTATISTGDVVTVRIQAPAGKKFVVHAPVGGPGAFSANVYWNTPVGGSFSDEPCTVTFENLVGVPPSESYSLVGLGADRQIVQMWKQYSYTTGFEFTAFRAEITAGSPHTPVTYTYKIFGSWSTLSFGASAPASDPQRPVMEIVDLPTPAQRTSWGRMKVLYR